MKKTVTASKFLQSSYAQRGHGSIELTLECGHTKYIKSSIKVPVKSDCRECSR